MKIKVYGNRATMPFFSRENIRFGGNTACFKIETGGHTIILDCGSGLAQYHNEVKKDIEKGEGLDVDFLLSHLHLDHITGLSTFSPAWDKKNKIRIFTKSRDDRPLVCQVFGIFKPPYWPVDLRKLNKTELIAVNNDKTITIREGVEVTPFKAIHQDDTTSFRVKADRTLVYLLDYEFSAEPSRHDALIDYCKNADIIIFDSSYLPMDYEAKKGWGHSTYEHGIELAKKCCCKQMLFSHFGQDYSDAMLNSVADNISCSQSKFILAYDGMELEI